MLYAGCCSRSRKKRSESDFGWQRKKKEKPEGVVREQCTFCTA